MTALSFPPAGNVVLGEDALRFAKSSKSANTVRAYRSDWTHFQTWCEEHRYQSYPASPEVVANYMAALTRTHKPASIDRKMDAIRKFHRLGGVADPMGHATVQAVWDGIRRTLHVAQEPKDALRLDDLTRMIERMPETTLGIRDRAMLTLGFAGAFRRSELVALNVEDIEFVMWEDAEEREWPLKGMIVTIRSGKTDQDGRGARLGIPCGNTSKSTCPVTAIMEWCRVVGMSRGPLFRYVDKHGHPSRKRAGERAVAFAVKRACGLVGMDPRRFAGHSLRSGFATAAAKAGIEERLIMRQTRHRDVRSARRYIHDAEDLFTDNPAGQIGL